MDSPRRRRMYVEPTPEQCQAQGLIYRRPLVRTSPYRQKSTLFEGGNKLVQINHGMPIHVGATCVRRRSGEVSSFMRDALNIRQQTSDTWGYTMLTSDALRLASLIRKLRIFRKKGLRVKPIRTVGGVVGSVDGKEIIAKNVKDSDVNDNVTEVVYTQEDRTNPPEVLKRVDIPDPSGLEFATEEHAEIAKRLHKIRYIDEYTLKQAENDPSIWLTIAGQQSSSVRPLRSPRFSPSTLPTSPLDEQE